VPTVDKITIFCYNIIVSGRYNHLYKKEGIKMKLNDYYYFANEELEKYYESWNARFLVNAAKWYITYKRQGGKRTIKRLDDLIASI